MKKFLSALVLVSFLAVLVVPMVALAQPVDECKLKHNVKEIDTACTKDTTVKDSVTKAWGLCCAVDGIYTITDWIFAILMILVILLVAWGAYDILTAAGGPEKIKAGRDRIIYAMVGLAVALLAKAIPSLVKALLGVA